MRSKALLPADMVHRLVAGENPLFVWREPRNLTQAPLAEAAGATQQAQGAIA
ncbi:MAG: hypothetical protein ACREWG_04785 [Gammaproteobacteria bacterium]